MILKRYYFRSIIYKCTALVTMFAVLLSYEVELSIILSTCITIIALDFSHPLVLKNYFLVYLFLLFSVARPFFLPLENTLTIHGIFYAGAFYFGTLGSGFLAKYIDRIICRNQKKMKIVDRRISVVKGILKLILVLKTISTIFIIFKTGIGPYFSGTTMLDTIESYGQQNVSGGINIILTSFYSSSIIAMVAMYVAINIQNGKRLNYFMLSYALLFLPLISLSRNAFAFGLVTLLLIFTMENKTSGRFSARLIFFGICTLVSLVFVSVTIGQIRESKLSGMGDGETPSSLTMIYGELSPILAYSTIKKGLDNETLNHQFGKTIIPPIALKVVPRSWYPEKPINSTAYYAQKTNRADFEAGFMIPSTFFGDLYLNFGLYVTILLCFIFGLFISTLDVLYILNQEKVIFFYLIIHNNFYAFLRNNIPEGFMNIALTFIIFFIYKAVVETLTRRNTLN